MSLVVSWSRTVRHSASGPDAPSDEPSPRKACSSRRPSWSRLPGFYESPASKIGRPSPPLRKLVNAEGVTVEPDEVIRRAIVAFEAGPADFSDYFIRESSREASALPVLTFDERFARGADVELVPEK